MVFVLGGTLELNLLIPGLRKGALGVHFVIVLRLAGRTLDPFFNFSEKGSNKIEKGEKKGTTYHG